jgi:hypothetical protein
LTILPIVLHVKIKIFASLIGLLAVVRADANEGWQHSDTVYNARPALQRYEGDWVYNDDSISFKLKLRIYPRVYSPVQKQFMDYMLGWYSYEKKTKDSIIREETLSFYDPSENPIKLLLANAYDRVKIFPTIEGYDRPNGDLQVVFRRVHPFPGPLLNMIGNMTYLGKNTVSASFRYGENFNTNHALDQQAAYFKIAQLPSEMMLKKQN